MGRIIHGKAVVSGRAEGIVLVSDEPISFWGGYDFHTGEITDRRHPLCGSIASGRILALPSSRGSSTTTAVLLESVYAKTAPAALVTVGVDAFFALASIVAWEMYELLIPIVSISPQDFGTLRTGDRLKIERNGSIQVESG
jgi:predicted aconitase with swiveling domain